MNEASASDSATRRSEWIGDTWGGLAAMLVALPAAIAFGVAIFSGLKGSLAAEGALAGILGTIVLGLMAPAFGGRSLLITAPCAPAAAVLTALGAGLTQQGLAVGTILILLGIIALLAGAVQVGLGVAGIGRLIKYIPYPVVSGYLSGVGLIIIGGQIPKFLGAPAGAGLLDALKAPDTWRWQSIAVGAVVIAVMLLTPRLTRAVPATILALLAGVGGYLALGLADPALLHAEGNPLVVGTLRGDGSSIGAMVEQHWLALKNVSLRQLVELLPSALTLAALLSIDTLKTGLVLDTMTRAHHDPDRELIGQGIGNLCCALVGGVPGSGEMGPSLINVSSGGVTWRSGVMAGIFSLLALVLLAPVIAWVPIAALAAILIVVGFRMIDRHSLAFFYSAATRFDFAVILAVILVAVFGNLIAASAVGVALAMLLFIREQTRSSVIRQRIEGRDLIAKRLNVPETSSLLERGAGNIVIFELQGSLFFGTASQLQAALEAEADTRKYIILGMRRVQSLDVTATHVLEQIMERLEARGACLIFSDIPKGLPSGLKMKHYLKETGVVRPTSNAFAFREIDDALEWVAARESEGMPTAATETLDLRAMPFLAGCSDAAVAALGHAVDIRTVAAGKRVFKAGSEDEALFFIRHGSVKLTVPIRKKDNYHLATCGPGDIIGDIGFIEAGPEGVDAVATVDSEMYVLRRDDFERLAAEHGDLAVAIVGCVARSLATRLHATIGEVQALRA